MLLFCVGWPSSPVWTFKKVIESRLKHNNKQRLVDWCLCRCCMSCLMFFVLWVGRMCIDGDYSYRTKFGSICDVTVKELSLHERKNHPEVNDLLMIDCVTFSTRLMLVLERKNTLFTKNDPNDARRCRMLTFRRLRYFINREEVTFWIGSKIFPLKLRMDLMWYRES